MAHSIHSNWAVFVHIFLCAFTYSFPGQALLFFIWHYCTLWCIFETFFSLFCLDRYCIKSNSSLLSYIILIISSFSFVSSKLFGKCILTCSVFNTYTQFHSDSYSCVSLIDQTHYYISFKISFDIFISFIIQYVLFLLSLSERISLTNDMFFFLFSMLPKFFSPVNLVYFLLKTEWSSGY